MNTNTADAGSAAVDGQPEAGQLRRSGDDRMLTPAGGQDQPAAAAWIAARRDRIR